jgi:hypothetical protein
LALLIQLVVLVALAQVALAMLHLAAAEPLAV